MPYRVFVKTAAFLALAVAVTVSGAAMAGGRLTDEPVSVYRVPQGQEPLVIIRFNQPGVHYKRALYTAISKAVETKPGVVFDLLSIVPTTGDRSRDEALAKQARTHVREVAQSMAEMGVPANRLNVNATKSEMVRSDEVHVFVR